MNSNISVVVRTERKRGAMATHFTPTEAQVIFEVQPDADTRAMYCPLDPLEREISNVPTLSNASTGTEVRSSSHRGQSHLEGGWPSGVDPCEPDERTKYCKKQMREEKYLQLCSAICGRMKASLRINCAIDIFENYFEGVGDIQGGGGGGSAPSDTSTAAETMVMSASSKGGPELASTAPLDSPGNAASAGKLESCSYKSNDALAGLYVACKMARPVLEKGGQLAHVNRAPQASFGVGSDTGKIYTAYYQTAAASSSWSEAGIAGAIWLVSAPTAPHLLLLSNGGGCSAIAPSSKDPHIIAGGSVSGIVQLWDDRRDGGMPVMSSDRNRSHCDAVTGIRHCGGKTVDFFSVGLDGQVLFWDSRKLAGPVEEDTVLLCGPTGASVGATDVDYDALVGGVQQYMVAGMDGSVFACTRRGRSAQERVLHRYQASYGSTNNVQRCPWAAKMFLTVGDWGFKIFGDEVREPILSASPSPTTYFTCGRWHPNRPTIVLTGTSDGCLLLWDITQSMVDPCMSLKISDRPLESIQPRGPRVIVTDKAGLVYAIALPDVICEPQQQERSSLSAMLDREYAKARVAQQQQSAQSLGNDSLSGFGGPSDSQLMTPRGGGKRGGSGGLQSASTFMMGGTERESATLADLTEAYLSHVRADDREEEDDEEIGPSGSEDLNSTLSLTAGRRRQSQAAAAADEDALFASSSSAGGNVSAAHEVSSLCSPPKVVNQQKPKTGLGAF